MFGVCRVSLHSPQRDLLTRCTRLSVLPSLQTSSGASAALAEIEKDTAIQIDELNKLAAKNSDEVITTLLKLVTKVDIKTHANFEKK